MIAFARSFVFCTSGGTTIVCFARADAKLFSRPTRCLPGPTIAGTKAEALCKFIGEVVEHRKAIGASLILEIIRAGSPVESVFTLLLCEDKLAAEHSYVDFLCWIHKEIQVGVSKD